MAPRHVEAEPFSSHQAVFVEVFTLSNIRRRLWGVVCTLAVTGAGGPVQQKSSNIIERDDVQEYYGGKSGRVIYNRRIREMKQQEVSYYSQAYQVAGDDVREVRRAGDGVVTIHLLGESTAEHHYRLAPPVVGAGPRVLRQPPPKLRENDQK
eukprot:1924981-Pyramimonas_sp.AAC.1